jgi:hypothetical protein
LKRNFATSWLIISASAIFLCAATGCGGPSRDIVGKWRSAGDEHPVVWEFSSNGSVSIGRDKGRYSFGDNNRIKIETAFAKTVYQMELSGDRMTLRHPNGLKLEFARIK